MNSYEKADHAVNSSLRQLAVGKHAVQLQDNRPKSQAVIQKKGERTAVENTRIATRSAGEQIRRGNRRNSIISTGGRSAAKLEISYVHPGMQKRNTGYRNKVDNLKNYVIGKMVNSGKYSKEEATRLIANNKTFLEAKAVEEISVGNCGEFSMVVFAHLVQNTTDQYIYRAKMYGKAPGTRENYDHAFAFTYNQAINVIPGVTTVDNIDKNKAIIADAWDGYKIMTLRQFQDGNNAYGDKLKNDNVRLLEMRKADGNQVFTPEIQNYITEWAIWFNKDFEEKMKDRKSTYFKEAKNEFNNPEGFNTEGTNVVGINDIRSFDQQFENSTNKEKKSIIPNASHHDLMNVLTNYPDEHRQVILKLMNNKQLRNVMIAPHPNFNHLTSLLTTERLLRFFKFLNETNKKILLTRLSISRIFNLLVGSESNRDLIIRLLGTENFINMVSRLNEGNKKMLLKKLTGRQIALMVVSKPSNLVNLIQSLPTNKLGTLLKMSDTKRKKRLLNQMTEEQRKLIFKRPETGAYYRDLYNS